MLGLDGLPVPDDLGQEYRITTVEFTSRNGLEYARDNKIGARIRCGHWHEVDGRYCDVVLSKAWPNWYDDVVMCGWGSPGPLLGKTSKPEIGVPDVSSHRDSPTDPPQRKRWECTCGATRTVRLDRLTDVFDERALQASPGEIFDLRFDVEL